jgi:membrane protein DedA with SNARE-associated domain
MMLTRMEIWTALADAALRLIDRYDELAIALLIFIEECGVPLPLPGDLVMMLAGARVANGQMSLWRVLVSLELVTVLGASILFWLGRRGGRPLLDRYGKYVHLDQKRIMRAEEWLHRRRYVAIVLGRILPGPRIATALLAGALEVPYRVFLPAMAGGAFVYILMYVLLGMWLGPGALELIKGPRFSLRAILTVATFVLLGALVFLLYRRADRESPLSQTPQRERRWVETAALAGFVATVEMVAGVNLALYAFGAAGVLLPEIILLRVVQAAALRRGGAELSETIVLLVVLLLASNVLYALLYAGRGVELLPGPIWLEGVQFSLLPSLVAALIVLPLLGAGFFGLGLGAGALPMLAVALTYALFGVGLAATHALLRQARNSREGLKTIGS